ncbi:MAG: glucose 1-dehydrogenase [Mycobacteriales bacterium]
MTHNRTLDGKTIIVTGGNSGIGAAIATAVAAAGASVVIDYVAHPGDAETLVAQIKDSGGNALAVKADVSSCADVHRLVSSAVEQFGRLDVMVNNAGIETRTSILDTTEADFDKVMAVNLKSAFFGIQYAAHQFIAQGGGGLVINISSVHEEWPMPGNVAYCVSKGGIKMLARTAGVELGQHGVRVINLGPGAVATPINESTMEDPAKMKALGAAIPLGRMAEPDEIAGVVAFLCSDQAGYLTATSLFVDGGIMQGSVGL